MSELSQIGEQLTIANTVSGGTTNFYEKNNAGTSSNPLYIGATGVYNTVPLVPMGVIPSEITQIGGTIIITGTASFANGNTSVVRNTASITLQFGTYLLVGSVDLSFNASSSLLSWGAFFNTSASTVPTDGYSISKRFVTGASGLNATKHQTQTTIAVNITSPTTIYLNYYAYYTTPTSIGFTSNSTIVATRLG